MNQDGVRARVEAFVADFHNAWERTGKPTNSSNIDQVFEAWTGELAGIVDDHFTIGASTGGEGSLSSSAAHDPSLETITEVKVETDRATVRSVINHGSMPNYYEYRLVREDEQWRICQLLHFFDPPGAPLIDPAQAEILLNAASLDAALPELPADLQLDVANLFAHGRQVAPFGEPVSLEVVRLGEVTCGSGVLTVRDFGYGAFGLAPLARRLPAGTYCAEVSTAAGTNVALRLLISEAPVVSWRPAEVAGESNVIGVDAGNVAVLDLANLVSCDAQQVEELYQEHSSKLFDAAGAVFSLTGAVNDAVMVTSGFGDGAYPCYWGVAEDGTIASLVVDFLVLIEETVRVITVPWQLGQVNTPELADHELHVTANGDSFVIRRTGDTISKIRVLAPDGTELMDGHRLGLSVAGDQHSQIWEPRTALPPDSILEVTLQDGYRHI
ncbi:DUF4241 domain-containing protein [Kribbella albertanoniae]|uniref:DUF4241 domain-containing protein n=1 Tax=Kribbella albertanoniae TaxID=1266829 RepID=A0A4R4PYN5_9ACTN|nr:DUF4241 domain-containing protein [Kribbella albertanoniae]TDC27688.1 DUF4241 domain-containing protein [Kribbella albertanoniae]